MQDFTDRLEKVEAKTQKMSEIIDSSLFWNKVNVVAIVLSVFVKIWFAK